MDKKSVWWIIVIIILIAIAIFYFNRGSEPRLAPGDQSQTAPSEITVGSDFAIITNIPSIIFEASNPGDLDVEAQGNNIGSPPPGYTVTLTQANVPIEICSWADGTVNNGDLIDLSGGTTDVIPYTNEKFAGAVGGTLVPGDPLTFNTYTNAGIGSLVLEGLDDDNSDANTAYFRFRLDVPEDIDPATYENILYFRIGEDTTPGVCDI